MPRDFDACRSRESRDKSINDVERAHRVWVLECLGEISNLAKTRATFTTDDVWKAMESHAIAEPREPRAMGAAMRTCARSGWIEPTNEYQPTKSVVAHRRPIRVWRSSVFR